MGMRKLKGGSSAATFYDEQSNHVVKEVKMSDPTSFAQLRDQHSWMKYHEKFGITPRIESSGFGDDTFFYSMEMLTGKPMNEAIVENPYRIKEILDFLNVFKKSGYVPPTADFSTYVNRLKNHIKNLRKSQLFVELAGIRNFSVDGERVHGIDFMEFFDFLQHPDVIGHFEESAGICHGDFTLENMFYCEDGIRVIDSNYIFGGWNSPLLDISKLFQSLHYSYEETFAMPTAWSRTDREVQVFVGINTPEKSKAFNLLAEIVGKDYPYILALEVSHYIRMLPYKLKISEGDFVIAYARLCQVYNDFRRNAI